MSDLVSGASNKELAQTARLVASIVLHPAIEFDKSELADLLKVMADRLEKCDGS